MIELELRTAVDTHTLGVRLGELAEPGDLIVLTGALGAGKTVLVQGIGAGLGTPGPINSPTFVISRIHRGGRLALVHVDAYRLGSALEVDDLDLDAEFADSVTAVEWGGGLVEQLADERLDLELRRGIDHERRTATLSAIGASWAARLSTLTPAQSR